MTFSVDTGSWEENLGGLAAISFTEISSFVRV